MNSFISWVSFKLIWQILKDIAISRENFFILTLHLEQETVNVDRIMKKYNRIWLESRDNNRSIE